MKTTLTGGLLVLFPLFGCAYVIVLIGGTLTSFIRPLLGFLPRSRFVGVAAADVASIFILLLLCFLIGLLVNTSVGNALGLQISRLLDRIPGYGVFRRISRIMFDQDDPRGSPVLVQRGQTKQIAFLVEENSAEELTVYFPSAPSPFSGSRDKRDSTFYPTKGSLFNVTGDFFDQSLGSRRQYQYYKVSYNHYRAISSKQILAYRGVICSANQNVPFYDLCCYGANNDIQATPRANFRTVACLLHRPSLDRNCGRDLAW